MKPPFFSHSKDLRSAVVFALLGQAVWLPLFYTSSTDNLMYLHSTRDLLPNLHTHSSYLNPEISIQEHKSVSSNLNLSSVSSANNINGTGIVLRSAFQDISISSSSQSRLRNVATPYLTSSNNLNSTSRPRTLWSEAASSVDINIFGDDDGKAIRLPMAGSFVHSLYSHSELLGGTLTLKNVNEPLMPALARAERAQWNRSGDPLAPLPQPWREPMRRALSSLLETSHSEHKKNDQITSLHISIDSARFVHVPSSRINRIAQIPLALQSDGSIDILSRTVDPVLLDEINRWSVKQVLPRKGKISAAVVNLHPLSVRSVVSDSRNIQSESPIAPGSDFSSKSQSAQNQSLQPSATDKKLSSTLETIPSQNPPVVLSHSSDMSTTLSPSSSPQTTERNPGNTMTAVPQLDIQGAAESLKEVGS
jgi:hypothetical protein